ncbi:phage virion morphogenesis protein [uncultured Ilyobacter sp.]|uniref:phage virion morphogenesis protein n=1 Tax=uncultured Ilyobacter sp. TaxID=544433 RepID=UPI002AA8A496|nr:phage virion morphogenesis protein [uncultured Ilyobacter sp.]
MVKKVTFEQFKAILDEKTARAKEMSSVMKKIKGDMQTKVDMRFRQAKGPDGTPWEPLKESTISKRKRRSSKPLNDSGDLKLSINGKYGSNYAVIGSDRPYAAYQQFPAKKGENGKETVTETVKKHRRRTRSGKKTTVKSHNRTRSFLNPWGDKPGRPFMGFSNNQKAKYRRWINNHIQKGGT